MSVELQREYVQNTYSQRKDGKGQVKSFSHGGLNLRAQNSLPITRCRLLVALVPRRCDAGARVIDLKTLDGRAAESSSVWGWVPRRKEIQQSLVIRAGGTHTISCLGWQCRHLEGGVEAQATSNLELLAKFRLPRLF